MTVILMPVMDHADGESLAEHGLRHYTTRVAAAVGAGPEAAWCEWADEPSAYIALDQKLPDHPNRDAALIWAAERGWAVAIETRCGEDLLIIASLGDDVLPAPETVAAWVRDVLTGVIEDRPPYATTSTDVTSRLANWARHDPTFHGRTA